MPELTKEQRAVLADPKRRADLLKQIEHIAASGQSDDFEGDIGPWMGTPLGPQAKSAWERGMSKRKQPSVRDDIERALDSEAAPILGGGILGAVVGSRLGRRGLTRKEWAAQRPFSVGFGGVMGTGAGAVANAAREYGKSKRRK